jgi:uncharacterized protein
MAQYAAERAEAAAVANPAPLGLSAFALTTFVLSSSNAGFLFAKPAVATAIVLGLALFYGGLVQLVAGVQAFRAGNTFAATAFCSYGGFWLAIGFTLLPLFAGGTKSVADLAGTSAVTGIGVFLLGWAIFTLLMFVGTLRTTLATMGVFFFLFITFLALAIGWLAGGPSGSSLTWIQIGGWLGIVTALLAWYDALAGILASGKSAFNLPTYPMS